MAADLTGPGRVEGWIKMAAGLDAPQVVFKCGDGICVTEPVLGQSPHDDMQRRCRQGQTVLEETRC